MDPGIRSRHYGSLSAGVRCLHEDGAEYAFSHLQRGGTYRAFHAGDVFTVRKGPITYTYRILQLCEHRLGAKLVPDYLRDETPQEQLELLALARMAGNGNRDRGTGRPTKKDRREIESFISTDYIDEFDSWDDEDEDE